MRLLTLCIFLFTVTTSFAQAKLNQTDSKGLKQAKWEKKYPNGNIAYTGSFFNNKPIGTWARFHQNGQKKADMVYDSKSDSCHAQLFMEDGKLSSEGVYINTKKEGLWKYYADGKVIATEHYTKGEKNGIAQDYSENGVVVEKVSWKNGKKDGVSSRMDTDKSLIYEMVYKSDKLNGLVMYYHPNGQIRMKGRYHNDLKEGEWKSYDKSGRVVEEVTYTNGIPNNYNEQLEEESRQLILLESQKGKFKEPEMD